MRRFLLTLDTIDILTMISVFKFLQEKKIFNKWHIIFCWQINKIICLQKSTHSNKKYAYVTTLHIRLWKGWPSSLQRSLYQTVLILKMTKEEILQYPIAIVCKTLFNQFFTLAFEARLMDQSGRNNTLLHQSISNSAPSAKWRATHLKNQHTPFTASVLPSRHRIRYWSNFPRKF